MAAATATLRYLADLGLTTAPDEEEEGGRTARTEAVLSLYRRQGIVRLIVDRLGAFAGIRRPETNEQRIGRVDVQVFSLHENKQYFGPNGSLKFHDLRVDAAVQHRIAAFRAANERWFYAAVFWTWRAQSRKVLRATDRYRTMPYDAAHMAVLVVDTRDRTYEYWDPNGGRWIVYNSADRSQEDFDPYAAFAAAAAYARDSGTDGLIAGYTYRGPPDAEAASVDGVHTVQNTLDDICRTQVKCEAAASAAVDPSTAVAACPLPPGGLCATSCLLVLACCLRFNAGQPHAFDRTIGAHLVATGGGGVRAFTLRLSAWHRRLFAVKSWESLERALGLVRRVPPAGGDAAGGEAGTVRCDHSVDGERPCPRPPCPASVFCEAHRYQRLCGLAAESAPYPPRLRCADAVPWETAVGQYVNRGPGYYGQTYIDVENTPLDAIRTAEDDVRARFARWEKEYATAEEEEERRKKKKKKKR